MIVGKVTIFSFKLIISGQTAQNYDCSNRLKTGVAEKKKQPVSQETSLLFLCSSLSFFKNVKTFFGTQKLVSRNVFIVK